MAALGFFLILAAACSVSYAYPGGTSLAMDTESLLQHLLKSTGLKKIPDVTRMNVSREEYKAKLQEYYTKVDERTRNRQIRHSAKVLRGHRLKRDLESTLFRVDIPSFPCHCDDRHACCRHQLKVKFDDLPAFKFVIQPRQFEPGYCVGSCPVRHSPANHHALLQSIYGIQNSSVPELCCVAGEYDDLELLHLDEDDNTKLKVSKWKNMIAHNCVCN